MTENYDAVVIGGGTGGYVAAIKLSQLGKKVALVEKSKLGGTCLNKGCIPTKSFLKSAELIEAMKHAELFGIDKVEPSFTIDKINQRKDQVVQQMQDGIKYLLNKNKVDIYEGTATILGPSLFSPLAGAVSVSYEDEDKESDVLVNDFVVIATGSKPSSLPFLPFDHKLVLSSDDLMQLEEIPKSIALIGGGVIGVEFATILNSFGANVTLIEASDRLLAEEDKDASKAIQKSLEDKGVKIHTSTLLSEDDVSLKDESVHLKLDDKDQVFDKVVVAIGRQPNTDSIGLNNTKVLVKENAVIDVNEFYQTKE